MKIDMTKTEVGDIVADTRTGKAYEILKFFEHFGQPAVRMALQNRARSEEVFATNIVEGHFINCNRKKNV